MTTSALALLLSEPVPDPLKKKRVLLVETPPRKRDLRAETMRKLEFAHSTGESRKPAARSRRFDRRRMPASTQ